MFIFSVKSILGFTQTYRNRRQVETQHDISSFAVNESIPKSRPGWGAHTRLGNLGKYPLPAPISHPRGGVGTLPNYIYRSSENGIWAHPEEKSWLRPCNCS